MPAFVKRSVRSSPGTSDDERTRTWPRVSKYLRNLSRSSFPVMGRLIVPSARRPLWRRAALLGPRLHHQALERAADRAARVVQARVGEADAVRLVDRQTVHPDPLAFQRTMHAHREVGVDRGEARVLDGLAHAASGVGGAEHALELRVA